MAKIIPNSNTWIGFLTTIAAASLVPTQAEVTAGVNLTPLVVSLTATAQGNVVPTPAFDNLFETSIVGTSQASFSADFYRDSVGANDLAWSNLPRGTAGYFVVSRFGGTGTLKRPNTGDTCEVWPVAVVSRAMQGMSNNTVQMFTVTCAVPQAPNEAAVVS